VHTRDETSVIAKTAEPNQKSTLENLTLTTPDTIVLSGLSFAKRRLTISPAPPQMVLILVITNHEK